MTGDPAPEGEHPVGPQPDDPYFVAAGSGSRHAIFPGVEIVTTAGEKLMLSVVTFEPHSVVLDHAHPHEQMGLMLSGRARVHGRRPHAHARPRRYLEDPRRRRHSVRALDGPAVALDVFHPIRDDYR